MVTDGSYTCGEHSVTYREVESLCFIPKINVTLYVKYTQFFFQKGHSWVVLGLDVLKKHSPGDTDTP